MKRPEQLNEEGIPQHIGGRTRYTAAEVDAIAEKLLAKPPIDRSQVELNKQAAVRRLTHAIASLQERGYTVEQVAESLCGVGLEITTPTLKSYLQRIRKENGKGARKRARPPMAPAAPATGAATPSPAVLPRPPSANPNTHAAPMMVSNGQTGEPMNGPPRSTTDEFLVADRKKL